MPRDDTKPVATTTDRLLEAAFIKALGLDKVPAEQRELGLAVAKNYGLDPMLRHLVLIDGRPYITRDGLIWVAHRSRKLDGIEVTDPELVNLPGLGDFWTATASVYRKDMSRPFVYRGRYPKSGGNNARYAPEMAVKVAEVMALRRAFAVAAPVLEERWEESAPVTPSAPVPSLEQIVAAKIAALPNASAMPDRAEYGPDDPAMLANAAVPVVSGDGDRNAKARPVAAPQEDSSDAVDSIPPLGSPKADEIGEPKPEGEPTLCLSPAPDPNPLLIGGPCILPWKHPGAHRDGGGDTWPRA